MWNKVYLNYDSTYVFNLICLLIELGKLTPQRMGFTRRYLWIYSLYSLCVRGDDLNKTCDRIIQLYDIQVDLQWHILTTRTWAISTHSALHYRIWFNKKNALQILPVPLNLHPKPLVKTVEWKNPLWESRYILLVFKSNTCTCFGNHI